MRHFCFLRAAPILAATLFVSFTGVAHAEDALPPAPPEPARTAPAPSPGTPAAGYYHYASPGKAAAPPEEQPMGPSPKAVQYRWSFEANARTMRFANTGYEAFTSGVSLPMATLGAYYGVLAQGPLSVHVGAQWSIGGIDGAARSQPTSLTVHQFGLGFLGRYRINHWLYPAVRVVPLAQYTSASLRPDDSPSRFDSKGFAFGADATAGIHFVPFTIGDVDWPKARIWIFLEGGVSFVTKREMKFEAHQADDDPRRLEDIQLRDLSTSGYLSRIGVAVSFRRGPDLRRFLRLARCCAACPVVGSPRWVKP